MSNCGEPRVFRNVFRCAWIGEHFGRMDLTAPQRGMNVLRWIPGIEFVGIFLKLTDEHMDIHA